MVFQDSAGQEYEPVRLIKDPYRSIVYVLLWPTGVDGGAGLVRAMDAGSEKVLRELEVKGPSAAALAPEGDLLYIIDQVASEVLQVDAGTFVILDRAAVPVSRPWRERPYDLEVGPAGVLYFSNGNWVPGLTIYDFVTKEVLSNPELMNVWGKPTGVGDLVLHPDGTRLFTSTQHGWPDDLEGGETHSDLEIVSWDVSDPRNPIVLKQWPESKEHFFEIDSHPECAEIGISLDPGRLWVKDRAFDFELKVAEPNLRMKLMAIDGAYDLAASPYGVVRLSSRAYLSWFSSGDYCQSPIFIGDKVFSISEKEIKISILEGLSDRYPMEEEAVPYDFPFLRWKAVPHAERYEVYLGLSPSNVAEATTDAEEYLGSSEDTSIQPKGTLVGFNYFWRVDSIVDGTRTEGEVWKFQCGFGEPVFETGRPEQFDFPEKVAISSSHATYGFRQWNDELGDEQNFAALIVRDSSSGQWVDKGVFALEGKLGRDHSLGLSGGTLIATGKSWDDDRGLAIFYEEIGGGKGWEPVFEYNGSQGSIPLLVSVGDSFVVLESEESRLSVIAHDDESGDWMLVNSLEVPSDTTSFGIPSFSAANQMAIGGIRAEKAEMFFYRLKNNELIFEGSLVTGETWALSRQSIAFFDDQILLINGEDPDHLQSL
ncbi:MAG: hypothetical protein AAF514_13450, partial [Verrucomicrobiota bacterium]